MHCCTSPAPPKDLEFLKENYFNVKYCLKSIRTIYSSLWLVVFEMRPKNVKTCWFAQKFILFLQCCISLTLFRDLKVCKETYFDVKCYLGSIGTIQILLWPVVFFYKTPKRRKRANLLNNLSFFYIVAPPQLNLGTQNFLKRHILM